MKLWIARDDYGLWLFDLPPIKRNRNGDKYFIWKNIRYSIDSKLFPELIWDNSPQRVELELPDLHIIY